MAPTITIEAPGTKSSYRATDSKRAALDRIDMLARVFDTAFAIPGTNFRFGIEAVMRLVPGIGITDVMAHFSQYGWWGSAASAPRGIGDATNQFAAMPSLHFGWSLWCAVQMWGLGAWWWRAGAVAYPSIQLFVVLATGNHFLLDTMGGALCVLVAYGVAVMGERILKAQALSRPSPSGTPRTAPRR